MYESRTSRFVKFAAACVALVIAGQASAAITFSGSSVFSGTGVSASATFGTDGNGDLIVTLVNTFTGDTPDQAHLLTALFFSGADGLTTVSAAAASGSTEWNIGKKVSLEGPSVLGQQWEYLSGLSGAPGNAADGISSSGFGIFGQGNFAANGVAVDGSPYALLSAGYDGSTGDGLKSQGPYIQDSMVFTLSGFNGDLSSINDVIFQYGTTLGGDSSFEGIPTMPEPNFGLGAALSLLPVIGFCGLKRIRQALV